VRASPPSTPREPLRFRPLDYACALIFTAYAAGATATPICLVHLSREFHLTLTAGGGIEAARSLLLLGMLLISGFLAARWGKAQSLGISAVVMGCGLFLYAFAPSYGAVLAAGGLLGAGGGVIEGLLNPLIQDLHPDDSGRYLNIQNAFWSVGVLLTVLAGGDLLTRGVSWRAVIGTVGVVAILAGLLFLVLERRSPHRIVHSANDVLGHKKAILMTPRFWLFVPLMFIAGGVEGAYTFWSASYIQLHYGSAARMGGIGTACFAGGMILGRLGGGWFVGQKSLRRLILASALLGFAVSLAVPFLAHQGALFAVLFLAGLSIACFWPSLQSYSADRIAENPTSLFILLSCAGIPGFALTSWAMGLLGDHVGLNRAFFLVPVLFAVFLALLLCERRGPRTREEALACNG